MIFFSGQNSFFPLAPGLDSRRGRCNATIICCAIGNSTVFPVLMTTLVGRNCDGGHYTCSPPKECCKQGCCFLLTNSVRAPVLQSGNIVNPLFLGHWYFWLAVTATVAGILCACSLWKRHNQGGICCRNSSRDERASEPESNGSFYAPPQYSRCNSFYQPPPPYSEVTSKPDLYPLVINFNGDPVIKANNGSTGYFMVQYFRNFIVRPVGSLSATSTLDSLSSSFICNATNEANIVPPPYSGISSLEEVTVNNNQDRFPIPRSISSSPSSDFNQVYSSPTYHIPSSLQNTPAHRPPSRSQSRPQSVVSIRDNPCFTHVPTSPLNFISSRDFPQEQEVRNSQTPSEKTVCDSSIKAHRNSSTRILTASNQEFENELELAEVLNTLACALNASNNDSDIQCNFQQFRSNSKDGTNSSVKDKCSVTESHSGNNSHKMNKEVSNKIQKHTQNQTSPPSLQENKSKLYFHKVKAKTMYMPLNEGPTNSKSKSSPNSAKIFSRGWFSKSAPTTPSGNIVPNFSSYKRNPSNNQKVKGKLEDGSPLLRENDESEEEHSRSQHL
ncbi:hypothetical protein WA026_014268 [Henosepilachna vigintioctopunctata]|uniref:WW domain binding protein VOPP1 n=1 Tax=Henosepilachna vigintioctopunctata TaxID=420089 RepID=A0AAW1TKJ6_9CUCU